MNNFFTCTPPLSLRTGFTIVIWLIALLVMAACSTAISPVSTQSETQTSPAKRVNSALSASSDATPISHVLQKKQQFFNFMKPIVIAENNKILQQRQHIMRLKNKTRLNTDEQTLLRHLSAQYHLPISTQASNAQWQALLNRIDIIPLDLVLAQAANESAWGKSRFARDGNNYFGQWCFRKGCGMVPSHRSKGASHEVRRFANATESVHAYMKNINTSAAYRDLRKKRQRLRQTKATIQADILANELTHYSERGTAYVSSIRSMIRSNRKLVAKASSGSTIQND
ncbi:MAG: glucosaminidase domain-containing protein [Mariprofundus sp.]|nr:glucosaminidase domain-containing protein [Mariprofundus sp.]